MTSEKENKAPWWLQVQEEQSGILRNRASRRFGEHRHSNISSHPAPIPLILSNPNKIVGSSSQIKHNVTKKVCNSALCTSLEREHLQRYGQAVIEQPIDACLDPPPAQLSVSPDFVERSLREVTEHAEACLGAGHVMGAIRDRRKSKPRGLLTAESDSRGSAMVSEEIRASQETQALSGPTVASVTWILLGDSGTEPDFVGSSQMVSHLDFQRYSTPGRASECFLVNRKSAPLKNARFNKVLDGDVQHVEFHVGNENTRLDAVDASEDSLDWESCVECSEKNISFCDYDCAFCHKNLDIRSSTSQQDEFSSFGVLTEHIKRKIHLDPDRQQFYREDSLATKTHCSGQRSLPSCRYLRFESKRFFECTADEPEKHTRDSVSIFDPETRGMIKLLKCSNQSRRDCQRTYFYSDHLHSSESLGTVSSEVSMESKDIHEGNCHQDREHEHAGFSKALAGQGNNTYISSHIKADVKLSNLVTFFNRKQMDERFLDCKLLISMLKQNVSSASQSTKCNCRLCASVEQELSSPEAWGDRAMENKQGCPIKMHVNLKEVLASTRRDSIMTKKLDKSSDIDSQLECNIGSITHGKSESSVIPTNMCRTGFGATFLMFGVVIVGYLYRRGLCQSGW